MVLKREYNVLKPFLTFQHERAPRGHENVEERKMNVTSLVEPSLLSNQSNDAIMAYPSLRTADAFPVVASLPRKNFSEGEKRRPEMRLHGGLPGLRSGRGALPLNSYFNKQNYSPLSATTFRNLQQSRFKTGFIRWDKKAQQP